MTEEPEGVLRPGHRIALGQEVYTVIQLNGTTVTLQDQHGELSAVMLGYLLTAPASGLGTAHGPALRARRHLAGTRRQALAGATP